MFLEGISLVVTELQIAVKDIHYDGRVRNDCTAHVRADNGDFGLSFNEESNRAWLGSKMLEQPLGKAQADMIEILCKAAVDFTRSTLPDHCGEFTLLLPRDHTETAGGGRK